MKKQPIAYSILELAIVSQGESLQTTLHNSLALAKAAVECAYKRIWFAEHHNSDNIGSSATSLLIGYIAENTTTFGYEMALAVGSRRWLMSCLVYRLSYHRLKQNR